MKYESMHNEFSLDVIQFFYLYFSISYS